MKISELKEGTADISGEVAICDGPKPTQSKFGEVQRTFVVIRDETGKIGGSLWRKDAERVAVGDKIEMFDVGITTYKGELQFDVHKGVKVRITKPATQATINKYGGETAKAAIVSDEKVVAPTVSHPSAAEGSGADRNGLAGRLALSPGATPETLKSHLNSAKIALSRAQSEVDELERQFLMGD